MPRSLWTTQRKPNKGSGIKFTNIMTFWLTGDEASAMNSVISGIGEATTKTHRWVRVTSYPPAL